MRTTSVRAALYGAQILLLIMLLGWMLQGIHLRADAQVRELAPALSRPSASLIQNLVDAISRDAIAQHIQYLQDDPNTPGLDSLGTRYSRSPGLAHAADYIARQFAQLGLEVEYDAFLYLGTVMTNVVATLPGLGPESGGIYILSAHFDSTAQRTSDWDWQTDPAPGADDNASGTAIVLELARVLSQEHFAHTLRFITFGGEEQGLLGSEHYAQQAWRAGQDIRGVINLDMVGWDGDGDRVMEIHAGLQPASIALAEAWKTALVEYDLNLAPQTLTATATTRSDHASFWSWDYPAVLLIEDAFGSDSDFNPYYHSTGDTFDKLDMSFAVDFARATVATLAELAGPNVADVTLSKTVEPTVVLPGGGPITYTLAFRNLGPGMATDVSIIDPPLPELYDLSYDFAGAAIIPGDLPQEWRMADLAPGEGGVITITARIDPEAFWSDKLTLDNQATISTSTVDANPDNNTSAAVAALVRRIYLPLVPTRQ